MLIELIFDNDVKHTFDTEHCRFDDERDLDWEHEIRSIIGKERNYTIVPKIIDVDLPNVESFVESELDSIDAETAIKSLNRLCNYAYDDLCAFEAYIQDTDDASGMIDGNLPDVIWQGYADDRTDAIREYFDYADISASDHREYLNLEDAANELCEKLDIAMYKGLAIEGLYSTATSFGTTPRDDFECDFVLTDQYKNQFSIKAIGDEFIVKAKNAKNRDLEDQIEVALTSGQTNFKISNFKSNAKLTGVSKLEDVQFLIHNLMAYARDYSYAFVCAVIESMNSSRYNRDDFEYAFEAAHKNRVLTDIRDNEELIDEYEGFEFSGSCYNWARFEKDYASDFAVGYCEENNQWYIIQM